MGSAAVAAAVLGAGVVPAVVVVVGEAPRLAGLGQLTAAKALGEAGEDGRSEQLAGQPVLRFVIASASAPGVSGDLFARSF